MEDQPKKEEYSRKTVLIDGVDKIAVHNGVVRIQGYRLTMDGKSMPELELHVPVAAIKHVADAFVKASKK